MNKKTEQGRKNSN